MKTIAIIIGLAILSYVGAIAGLYFMQRRMTYQTATAPYYDVKANRLLGVDEVVLKARDGTKLIAWHSPAKSGKPTLLYFHGNAAGLIDRFPRIERFAQDGYGVFMPAYRGYSGSEGTPSEAAIIEDAQLAYDYLRETGLDQTDIVLYGESLGTGVAVQLAGLRPVAGLVLDAPYTSLPDVAKRCYPYAPVHTFMTERYASHAHIGKVEAPILIMHGTLDKTIPIDIGKALFDLAPEPKYFVPLAGAAHSDLYDFGALDHLDDFLSNKLVAGDGGRELEAVNH